MIQHTFLVEIGTEELPPKILRILGESFSNQIKKELNTTNIYFNKIEWFASPRRLAVKVKGIKNYKIKNNTKNNKFIISNMYNNNHTKIKKQKKYNGNIQSNKEEISINKKEKNNIYENNTNKKIIQNILYNIIINTLKKLSILKLMYWGEGNIKFVRPVHTITLLLDEDIIIGNILGIKNNRILKGHLFMENKEIIIKHANDYPEILFFQGKVIADYIKRKEIIRKNINIAAKKLGGIVNLNKNLLEEVTSLVEWPVVLTAHFKKKFLTIPKEILITTMENNQKYFPVYNNINGNLLPNFIFVANIESKNKKNIISGNERVMHSRLSDAEFFFNNDCKKKLKDRLLLLKNILFQKKLGTLYDKSNRIKILSSWIANKIGANVLQAEQAGLLSKCDLTTNIVSEFPDIQGIIGMYYAINDGESKEVALAQKEQYKPKFYNDTLPTTLVSCTIAIADKIDTLTGIFGINQYPKKNNDPFSLRRAALGILRIIVEKKLQLDLNSLIKKSVYLYNEKLINKKVISDVINFILKRFINWYKKLGYSKNIIQSVLTYPKNCLIDFDARIQAVKNFITLKESKKLIITNKRILNILEKSNVNLVSENLQTSLLKKPEEIKLATHLQILHKKIELLLKKNLYQESFKVLTTLCEPIDIFFKNVMIMENNYKIRVNRLTLLCKLRKLFLKIADISLL